MSSPYRAVLSLPGAGAFTVAGLVGRMPMSMIGLGIVLLVTARTGSYGLAGQVAASYVVANALLAVPLARLVDRLGQRAVLAFAAAASSAALASLVVVIEQEAGTPWPHLLAALSGATQPNLGAAVRARWSHVVQHRPQLETAFALEAVNDEVVFMVGPAVTTLLAAAVHPALGLVTAAGALLVGTLWFASQRGTEPPAAPRSRSVEEPSGPPMPWAGLMPILAGSAMLGILFGGCEVAVVAFSEAEGAKALSGVVLAVWALGSLLSGLVVGHVGSRRSAAQRYAIGMVALGLVMVPLPFVGSLAVLTPLMFGAGLAISPTLIAAVSRIEQLVPSGRLTEGMTAFSTALTAGVAPGAAVAGAVVDRAGASAAFWVSVVAGAAGAATTLLVSQRVAAREPAPGQDRLVV